jgi:hypothetical protein
MLTARLMQRRTPRGKWRGPNPTTAAGAAALLAYIAIGPITGLFELGECRWHETAFRNVVASLARITRQSQQAA